GRGADRRCRRGVARRLALSERRCGGTGNGTPPRGPRDVVAVTRSARAGWIAAAGGLLLLVAAARLSPTWHRPLYDGVVFEDPYRYLQPPAGKPGNPTSVSDTLALDQGVSPQLYSGTLEQPPQAQMIADRDAFQLPAGTTSIKATIQPIKPPAPVS